MAKSREIKRRLKAVGNIKRITKTMQMIATTQFQRAFKRATASQPYAKKISQLVSELSGVAGDGLDNPLLTPPSPPVGRRLVLIITSNRGLCGGYNANILKLGYNLIKSLDPAPTDIELVGKKGHAFFRFSRREVAAFHGNFTDAPTFESVEALADRYMADFSSRKYDSIQVVYMSFISAARQSAKVLTLLPMEKPAETPGVKTADAAVYDFSPGPKELLAELLPLTVKITLFQCFNEAVVSEQIARMVAMKSATDAAGKMGKTLARKYNRARQAAITTELSEIIAGAASLK